MTGEHNCASEFEFVRREIEILRENDTHLHAGLAAVESSHEATKDIQGRIIQSLEKIESSNRERDDVVCVGPTVRGLARRESRQGGRCCLASCDCNRVVQIT